jgi:hypothetical protein
MTRFMRSLVGASTLSLLVFFCCHAAPAQTVTASVRGVVTDQTGAIVPDATVTAINVTTGVKTATTSNRTGAYNIQTLPIGSYTISGTASGFGIFTAGPFSLEIDQIAKIDIKLQVGSVATNVEVSTDSTAILQTENATLGTTVTSSSLESLPLSGQNFLSAALFVPGAVNPTYSRMGGSSGTGRDTDWGTQPSINGNRQQANNYILDGADINEPINNLVGYNPAPEALQQMRVITGNADAEYGNVNGGEIIMVTKGGTNAFHGSLYSFYENQDLTANLWSNNYNDVAKGKFHQNQFGATFGGPVLHNKLFFFVDLEGYRNSTAGSGTASVPTERMRSGDFSELLGENGSSVASGHRIQLFDTSNGLGTPVEYADNQIEVANPVAKYLFAHPEVYPLPNRAVPTANQSVYADYSNYISNTQTINVNNQGDVRGDYVLSNRDSINARLSMGDAWDATPQPVLPITFPGGDDYPYIGGVVNEVHVFSSALVNNLRAGYSRVAWLQGVPVDSTGQFGLKGDSVVGIPYANQPYAGFSQINLSSAESNVGTRGAVTTYYDNIFSYGDDVSWLHGHHIVKGGAQVLRYQENNYYPSTNGNLGLFSYNGAFTANTTAAAADLLPTGVKSSGWGFADFVLDKSSSQGVSGVAGRVGQRMYRLAFYAQDDWKITPALTVNIGVRYGYDQPLYEVNNKMVNVDLSLGQSCNSSNCLMFAGQDGNSRALYDPFYGGVMPRVGFALQLSPRLVLSGGYGITDDMEGTGSNLRLTQNAPYIFQYSNTATTPSTSSGGTPTPAGNGFALSSGNVTYRSTRYQAYSKKLRPSVIQQMNLTTQLLLDHSTTFQLSYVGQLGQHLVIPQNANQWTTPGDSTTAPFINLVGKAGLVYETQSEGYSNYHALQTQIRHRQGYGLEYTFNYTFSKSLTNNPGFYGVQGVDGASVFPQNIYNPHGDYGPAGYDTRNAVNFNGIYTLPFGHGRQFGSHWNTIIDEVAGGWKLSGDAILYSGFPITITSTNVANANASTARANQYQPLRIAHRSVAQWFGTDPSATPCTSSAGPSDTNPCAYGPEATNSFGTARVGTERAPGYRIIDLSVFKEFHIFREHSILFRVDAFNAFNLASYSAPTASVSSTSFGRITSTLSPARQLQLSAKYRF